MIIGAAMITADKFMENVALTPMDILLGGLQPLSLAFFAFFMLTINSRVEIRGRGVLVNCRMIRWSNIESYAWESSSGEWEILRMRSKDFWRFLPADRIPVQRQLKDRANELLELQLSTWSATA
jgi:hypothetical protein